MNVAVLQLKYSVDTEIWISYKFDVVGNILFFLNYQKNGKNHFYLVEWTEIANGTCLALCYSLLTPGLGF